MSVTDEQEIRSFCSRLLAGEGEIGDEELFTADEALGREVRARLEQCGVRLVRNRDAAPLCVIADAGEEMQELALACLALCALALHGPEGRNRAKLTVKEIWERVGVRQGYSETYVRRAGLGPLETRGLISVTKPGQRATEAYVTAGPALAAIDASLVEQRLRAYKVPA